MEDLRKEDSQPEPFLMFTITDEKGDVVRHIKTGASKGLKRLVWDFRHNTPAPVTGRNKPAPDQLFGEEELGQLAIPGKYFVAISKFEDGEMAELTQPVAFSVKSLGNASLPAEDQQAYLDFCKKVSDMRKTVSALSGIYSELDGRLSNIKTALEDTPAPPAGMYKKVSALQSQLRETGILLNGDATLSRREFETAPSVTGRVSGLVGNMWSTTSAPPQTYRDEYAVVARQIKPILDALKSVDAEINGVEKVLGSKGAPYTPGRWPEWK